jgi:hypothetical protein
LTPIVQLRKELRVVSIAPEGQARQPAQLASAHVPLSVLKILGLKYEE